MDVKVCVLFLAVGFIGVVVGREKFDCKTGLPTGVSSANVAPVSSQTAGFTLSSVTTYTANGSISVTLTDKTRYFSGFMIQARGPGGVVFGTWSVPSPPGGSSATSNSGLAVPTKCIKEGDTLMNGNSYSKNKVVASWTATDVDRAQYIEFLATVTYPDSQISNVQSVMLQKV